MSQGLRFTTAADNHRPFGCHRFVVWSPKIRRRLTLFGEVTNVLGRGNQRQIPPFVSTRTGQVFRPFDTMFPRIPSVGVTVEF